MHVKQDEIDVASVIEDQVPATQSEHEEAPAADHVPVPQEEQTKIDVEPGIEDQVPASQLMQNDDELEPSTEDHVPAPQF